MPSEIRVYPASSRALKNSGEVDSGFDSVVTSAPGASPRLRRTAPRTRVRPSAPSSDGVPPPRKTVDGGPGRSHSAAARSSSASSALRYVPTDEVPSSPGV